MRIKLDENLSRRGAEILRAAGPEVTTVPEEELTSAKRDWIPFVSLGVFMGTLILGIAGFGFERISRLEARMDRIEERLNDLDRRVSRIEGILMIRVDRTELSGPVEQGRDDPPEG